MDNMRKQENICPICGSESLIKKNITETFEYKGQTIDIEDYIILECQECEESIIDKATLKEAEKVIRDFHRSIDGLLTSKEIRTIRKALGFTQKDFGLLLGGGKKGFARYESCSVTQSKAMDNLLRVVMETPVVIDTLQRNHIRSGGSFEFQESLIYHYETDDRTILKVVGK